MNVTIRAAARLADEDGILRVVAEAFADATRDASEELGIVRATWEACDPAACIELVADKSGGAIVGHLVAAPGRLDGKATTVAGVAPVCVAPAHQGQGVGTALLRALVTEAESRQWPLLVLLGDPGYYARVGFVPSGPLEITYAPAGEGSPHFQARRLSAYDASSRGMFTYCWETG